MHARLRLLGSETLLRRSWHEGVPLDDSLSDLLLWVRHEGDKTDVGLAKKLLAEMIHTVAAMSGVAPAAYL